jgi:hypothetical protein
VWEGWEYREDKTGWFLPSWSCQSSKFLFGNLQTSLFLKPIIDQSHYMILSLFIIALTQSYSSLTLNLVDWVSGLNSPLLSERGISPCIIVYLCLFDLKEGKAYFSHILPFVLTEWLAWAREMCIDVRWTKAWLGQRGWFQLFYLCCDPENCMPWVAVALSAKVSEWDVGGTVFPRSAHTVIAWNSYLG